MDLMFFFRCQDRHSDQQKKPCRSRGVQASPGCRQDDLIQTKSVKEPEQIKVMFSFHTSFVVSSSLVVSSNS